MARRNTNTKEHVPGSCLCGTARPAHAAHVDTALGQKSCQCEGEEDNGALRRLHPVLAKLQHLVAIYILHSVLRPNPSLTFIHRDTCRESHGMCDILVNCRKYKLKSTTLAPRSHAPGCVPNCDAEPLMKCLIHANNLSTSHHGAKSSQR